MSYYIEQAQAFFFFFLTSFHVSNHHPRHCETSQWPLFSFTLPVPTERPKTWRMSAYWPYMKLHELPTWNPTSGFLADIYWINSQADVEIITPMKSGKIRRANQVWQASEPVVGAMPLKGHAVIEKYLQFLIYSLVSMTSSPPPHLITQLTSYYKMGWVSS